MASGGQLPTRYSFLLSRFLPRRILLNPVPIGCPLGALRALGCLAQKAATKARCFNAPRVGGSERGTPPAPSAPGGQTGGDARFLWGRGLCPRPLVPRTSVCTLWGVVCTACALLAPCGLHCMRGPLPMHLEVCQSLAQKKTHVQKFMGTCFLGRGLSWAL